MDGAGDEGLRDALASVEALYTENLKRHGLDSRTVGWKSEDQQRLRFEKLAYLLEAAPSTGPVSVADLGCGYGAMFGLLAERLADRLERYVGYDLSEEMLQAARRNVSDPRAEFVRAPALDENVDYAFVSGTFHVKLTADDELWAEYIRKALLDLGRQTRLGFAFNLFTTFVDWREDHLFYGDPAEWLRFCQQQISPQVSLLHDYPLYEWTLVVRSAAQSGS